MGELECSYLLLEVMFRRLDKTVAEKSGILHKTLMQVAHTHIKKTGEKGGKAGTVSYLAFHCAAYNCLAAAVARTQNVQKFFDGLCFAENAARGEILWENIVDTAQPLRFTIDTAFELIDTANPAIRAQSDAGGNVFSISGSSSKYLSSQYLANSSLSQDVSDAFFADAGPRLAAFSSAETKAGGRGSGPAAGDEKSSLGSFDDDHFDFKSSEEKKPAVAEGSGSAGAGSSEEAADTGDVAVHEMDALNQNRSMASILYLIDHMNTQFGARWQSVDMPEWMKALHNKLSAMDGHINVKWFIAKIVIARRSVFGRWARAWFGPLISLAILPADKNGGVGFHYFLRDLSFVFLSWGAEFLNDAGATERDLASRFVAHLMRQAADYGTSTTGEYARLRDNLKWIKLLVQTWSKLKLLTIDKSVIMDLLKAPLGGSSKSAAASASGAMVLVGSSGAPDRNQGIMKRVVACQLIAIILANGKVRFAFRVCLRSLTFVVVISRRFPCV